MRRSARTRRLRSGRLWGDSPPLRGGESQVYPYLWASEAESMGLSPSRIKDGAHGDGDFHADLLFEQSAWKIRRRWTASRGMGRIKQLQFRAETSDQPSGAGAARGPAYAPGRPGTQSRRRAQSR